MSDTCPLENNIFNSSYLDSSDDFTMATTFLNDELCFPTGASSLVSFVAGAVCVGVLWYAHEQLSRLSAWAAIDDDDADEVQGCGKDHWYLRRSTSWMDPWTRTIVQEWAASIMASRRRRGSHWPWDKMHRRRVDSNTEASSPLSDTGEAALKEDAAANAKKPTAAPATPSSKPKPLYGSATNSSSLHSDPMKKKGPCIGSIFGLDVGGTLTKLVYFEEKTIDFFHKSDRARHYHHAASAQAVLAARRGVESHPARRRQSLSSSETTHLPHSPESNADLHQMFLVRQESEPDDLETYANSIQSFRETHVGMRNSCKDDEQQQQQQEQNSLRKRVKSMLNLSQLRDHAQALDRFYHYARRLDEYRGGVRDKKLSFYSRELGGEFHFIKFETRHMPHAVDLIRANRLHDTIREMGATGGGAHKYANTWHEHLGITIQKQEELDSLVAGMQFVMATVVGDCYTFKPRLDTKLPWKHPWKREDSVASSSSTPTNSSGNVGAPLEEELVVDSESDDESDETTKEGDAWWWSRKVQRDAISFSSQYPYLLVTIGTGVSILRVDGPRKYERISGSSIGGGTYWGLMRLLTDVESFDDVMRLAERGNPAKVDMMVGDIYGKNSTALEKVGLNADIVASSFGKLVAKEDPSAGIKQEDLARALLMMVTINIGQVAYLNAKLYKTSQIYFVGNFLRGNKISQRRLAYAIQFWSKGEMEALFLEREGYFGALGAFLLSQGISINDSGFIKWQNGGESDIEEEDDDDDSYDYHDEDDGVDEIYDEAKASSRAAAERASAAEAPAPLPTTIRARSNSFS